MTQQENQNGTALVAAVEEVASFGDSINLAIQRSNLFDKVRVIALKATNHLDWIDQNGQPYLQGPGAEKVMRRFGLRVWDVKREKYTESDDKGDYYYFRYTARVGFNEREFIEAVGTCSSRDQFFAMREGKLIPTSEVDITNIEKSAYTNCLSNGVTRFLGIRSVEWKELEEVIGIKKDQVQKVEYGQGKKSAQWTEEHIALARRIGNFLLADADGNKEMAEAALEKLTAFKGSDGKDVPGKRNLKNLSGRQIEILYGKLKKNLEEFEKAGAPAKEAVNGTR